SLWPDIAAAGACRAVSAAATGASGAAKRRRGVGQDLVEPRVALVRLAFAESGRTGTPARADVCPLPRSAVSEDRSGLTRHAKGIGRSSAYLRPAIHVRKQQHRHRA